MRKLSKYLVGDFLTTFSVAMLLITFSFSIGVIYKAIDIMAKGLPVGVIVKFILYGLPYSMAFTIPISALFATLLLFGRLSSDSEVSAMKSGGMSLWQIASPILIVTFVLMGLCFYNNCIIYPKTTYASRTLLTGMGVEDPIKLLEEGRFIREFPGYMIYVGKKNKNRVKDLVVYETDRDTKKVKRTIRAGSGIMTADETGKILKIDLFDARVELHDEEDPDDSSKTKYLNAEELPIRIDIGKLMEEENLSKKRKNMTIFELIYRARNVGKELQGMSKEDLAKQKTYYRVEIHQRICLSISPLMFVLIGIPLGITSHRKESSIGLLMSLAIMFVYYLFIILSDTFEDYPHAFPWLIPWVPIVAGQIGALILMRRAD